MSPIVRTNIRKFHTGTTLESKAGKVYRRVEISFTDLLQIVPFSSIISCQLPLLQVCGVSTWGFPALDLVIVADKRRLILGKPIMQLLFIKNVEKLMTIGVFSTARVLTMVKW